MKKYKQFQVLIKANLEGNISLKNIIYLSRLYLTTYSRTLLRQVSQLKKWQNLNLDLYNIFPALITLSFSIQY